MRSLRVLLGTLATVLVVGACSDGDATSQPEVTPTPAATADAPASEAVEVSIHAEAHEWYYTPDAWAVTAGEAFSIEFINDGGIDHDWTVLKLDENIELADEFEESRVLLEVAKVPGQESRTETFTIDEPGTYQVVCTISGHFNTGMAGTLTVE